MAMTRQGYKNDCMILRTIEDEIPNYSTWSQNYKRRYKDSDIFNIIFKKILKQAIEYGFVDMSAVFYDGTHQKANANKRKCTDEEVEIEAMDLGQVFRHKIMDSLIILCLKT